MSDETNMDASPKSARDLSARTALVVLSIVIALTGVFRVWYVLTQPMPAVVADAAGYDASALRLIDTGTYAFPFATYDHRTWDIPPETLRRFYTTPPNAFTVPGYTWFLAGVYELFGRGPDRLVAVRVAQALLSLLLIGLVYAMARRVGGRRWEALLAAVLTAVYPPFTWATGHILTETPYTVIFAASVLMAIVAVDTASYRRFAAAGLLAGLAAIVRPVGLVWLVVPFVFVLFARPRHGWRRSVLAGAALAIGVLLVIGPWAARNYAVYGKFIPLTTSAGNALASSTTSTYERTGKPDVEFPTQFQRDDYALGQYWAKVGQERLQAKLRTDPAGLLSARSRIVASAVLGVWPVAPSDLMSRLTIWFHKLLLALFVAGVILRRRTRDALLLASVPLFFVVTHAISLITTRYLLPAMPFVIVLAACAAGPLVDWISALRGRAIFTPR